MSADFNRSFKSVSFDIIKASLFIFGLGVAWATLNNKVSALGDHDKVLKDKVIETKELVYKKDNETKDMIQVLIKNQVEMNKAISQNTKDIAVQNNSQKNTEKSIDDIKGGIKEIQRLLK